MKKVLVLILMFLAAACIGAAREIVVNTTADSGTGTLRWALQRARSGDAITFDPIGFPPDDPATIYFRSELLPITCGDLTIDASNAGVVIDGKNIRSNWAAGLTIRSSDNSIQGLQISNFSGAGIALFDGSQKNVIGGNRKLGVGPTGQGNALCGNNGGIGLWDRHTSYNTVTGNLIGVNVAGREPLGNIDGVVIAGGASDNTIGPDNVIAHNQESGVLIIGSDTAGNTITQNSIHSNGWVAIRFDNPNDVLPAPPTITGFDLELGQLTGLASPGCTIEVFSDNASQGEVYEGQSTAEDNGVFIFDKGSSFSRHHLTVTATCTDGSTSEFSRMVCEVGLGRELIVTNMADSGYGTLRRALQEAGTGDTISFDPAVFPIANPATIHLDQPLPLISQGALAIDASNTGVILDGSNIPQECPGGLEIVSDGNTICGLQIVRFPGAGIWIHSSSVGNTIGPDNVIAYNEGPGVGMSNPDSLRNTITRNSIHDNRDTGIGLWNGSYAELSPPLITGFDWLAGTVGGTACPNCTVEIFSDNVREGEPEPIHPNSEGEFYEGQAKVDGAGFFSFDKHAPFTAPHLTATATDSEGHTSEFSVPTTGTNRSWVLQLGSNLLKTQLQPRPSENLDDNRMGDMYSLCLGAPRGILCGESPSDFVNRINEIGLKWMNVSLDYFDWNEVGPTGPFSEHSVDPLQDQAIAGLVDLSVSVMCGLVFWDEGILTRLEEEGYSRFQAEGEIQRYLDYVRFVVGHFRGLIEYYQILNEPNVGGPGQYVAALDYVNLVRRTVPIIRREDPEAKIVVGALPILDPEGRLDAKARDYLLTIVTSDIMPLVDAVSWHPGPAFSARYYKGTYYRYPLLVLEMQDIAVANGFGGEYIIDGLGWRTARSFFSGEPWVFTETVAAKNLARGVVLHCAMNAAPGLADSLEGPKMPVTRNLCTVMAGNEAIDMPVEIDIDYEPAAYCAFRYPNGDRMLAVWTDGVAQDEDPGVSATISFPGLTAGSVTGIDVLNGFEQELTFELNEEGIVIRDLLVKDYPVLIRLSDVTVGPDYEETVGAGFHRLGEPGTSAASDRDGDGVPDDEDHCPDWPGSHETNGC